MLRSVAAARILSSAISASICWLWGGMHATRRGGVREIRTLEVAAGDPFRTAKLARHLEVLEDQLRHELMDDEGRQELRDRVLRRRLSR